MTSPAADGSDRGAGEPAGAPKTKVPLDAASVGRLEIRRRLDRVRISADPNLGDLLHGWWRREPDVAARGGEVTLTYPRRRMARWGTDDIALNASVPWDISIQGGVRSVAADLRLLKLRSLTVEGGVSQLVLVLGRARDEVPIELGAADRVTIRRPAESQVRLQITKGAFQVAIDDQTYSALGGETVLTTGPVLRNAYHVNVTAVRRFRVTTL